MAKTSKAKKAKTVAKAGSTPAFDRICNLVPSRGTEKDWDFQVALAANAIGAPAQLPASVDLRADDWWAINDQETTGSCVGWASTDSVLRYHMVQAMRLAKGDMLSPRFTWMASKETDEFDTRPETFVEGAGTSLKNALDILRKYGSPPEAMLPFHLSTSLYLGNPDTLFASAANFRIASYFNLKLNLRRWREWLATQGPLLVGLNVDATWDNAQATGGNLDAYQPGTQRGGHAIAVVGYTADGRFILRNSWGRSFGDRGYGYATEAYILAGFFDEAYGIKL
jgi:C1A family cysteine protease